MQHTDLVESALLGEDSDVSIKARAACGEARRVSKLPISIETTTNKLRLFSNYGMHP
jgi:hypothetical protein